MKYAPIYQIPDQKTALIINRAGTNGILN